MSRRYEKWIINLFNERYEAVHRYLSIILHKKGRYDLQHEVSDYIQETFILAWEKRESLKDHPNIDAWLLRTARNILSNKLSVVETRERHTAFSLDKLQENGEALIDRIDLQQPAPDESDNDILTGIQNEVDEETYSLLLKYYDKDCSVDSIANELRISKSGVKMRVNRAIARLREIFSDDT